ncbi:DsrE family protein [Labrys portucalensis]|uniref:DsrE family protein n=1 Tax=Labrys neptuniae TaxID=376174 RepID=A0ABV6ZIZ3_9HYPH
MDRRTAVRAMLASGPAILVAGAGGSLAAEARPMPRIAYHLADLEKAGFVLGNLRNHVDGMGGPEGVKLAVVVHGPALRAFRADSGNEDFKARFGRLLQEGVAFHACRHTMDGMKLGLSDLLPGFAVAEKGGVVLLAELQSEGWLYLRP